MTAPIPYTALAATRRPLADIIPLPGPFSVHVEPTNLCSLRCISCPRGLPDYAKIVGYEQFMDFSLYEKIIRDLADIGGIKAIKLFGYGEPTLHPDLARMVRLAKTCAERVEFTSNVSNLTESLSAALIDAQLDYIRISIYSLDQAEHKRFTGRNISIEKIYDNIRKLRMIRDEMGAKRPWIYVKMFDFDAGQGDALRARYGGIADEIVFEILHNMTGVDGVDERFGVTIPVHQPKKICPQPFFQSNIGANGDVTICCVDWSFAAKVGNVKEQSFRDIWFGEKLQEIRRKHLEGRACEIAACKNCTWNWSSPDDIDGLTEAKKTEILDFYQLGK